ncbi:MAG: TonB-dependent receptor [Ignavibacteriae bacterium]|nr:TonB-dependent receptor [Ignavibacteriota bacterium]
MRKFFLICCILVFECVLLKSSDKTVHISGNVYNQKNDDISYVTVKISDLKQTVATNSKGYFSFPTIPAGKYNIRFSHISYHTLDTVLDLNNNLDDIKIVLYPSDKKTDEIVVTSTRTYKHLENLPIPADVISDKDIENHGILKLDGALSEQLGLNVLNNHGSGVQLQGLDADYTLILLNGEPVAGRTGGILDLSRFTLGNVQRIEVVRGPSSSLYGSNALAGVINIITEKPSIPLGLKTSLRYGSNSLLDLTGNVQYTDDEHKLGVDLFINRYFTKGFNLKETNLGQTVPEVESYTFNTDIFYNFSLNTNLKFSGRVNFDNDKNKFTVIASGDSSLVNTLVKNDETNFSIKFNHKFSDKIDLEARAYTTSFGTKTNSNYAATGEFYSDYSFWQGTKKMEIQSNLYSFLFANIITAGLGGEIDNVEAGQIANGGQSANLLYGYFQYDSNIDSNFNLIASIRYDSHSDYNPHFSPKIAVSYNPLTNLTLRASIGNGFKAPDFEQLYLDWTNPFAGYSVLGVAYVEEGIRKMNDQGIIDTLFIQPKNISKLYPESSFSLDFGFNYYYDKYFEFKANAFRNNISDMIEFLRIGIKKNGQNLHTYTNLNRIYTQGIEAKIKSELIGNFMIEINYQFLQTGDEDVLDKIRNKKIYKRGSTGIDRPVQEVEYGGLFYRPEHSGALKLQYNWVDENANISIRALFKGQYGWADLNGNGILDDKSEYAPPTVIWNLTASKELFSLLTLQLGIDNILGYKDIRMLSVSPGTTFYINLTLNLNKY